MIPARPSGLAVVTGANRESTRMKDDFDRIVAEYREVELGYDCLDSGLLGKMAGILPNDRRRVDEAIAEYVGRAHE
jgi:hypothetical protein